MSLRVLLADESDTIKKVFQLALQDFNAEIKGVHSGLDVIDVALAYKPDIIFADVLLQKKNGYDTCLELKQHPKLSAIPVVLMWSSFMELDQGQFKRALANDQLEKPFDADFLRDLVKKYVPVVADNPMAQFLNFPKSLTEDLKRDVPPSAGTSAGTSPSPATPSPSFVLPDAAETPALESSFHFGQVELSRPASKSGAPPSPPPPLEDFAFGEPDSETPAATPKPEAEPLPSFGESWKTTDLSKFKVDTDKNENLDKFESLNLSQSKASVPNLDDLDEKTDDFSQIAVAQLDEVISFDDELKKINSDASSALPSLEITEPPSVSTQSGPSSSPTASAVPPPPPRRPPVSEEDIESIVRAHTEEYIKTEIHQTLMEMVERIVREELSKLLDEEVRLKQELGSDPS